MVGALLVTVSRTVSAGDSRLSGGCKVGSDDLQKRVNTILDELFKVASDLQELRDHGLDNTRAHRVEGFAEILQRDVEHNARLLRRVF